MFSSQKRLVLRKGDWGNSTEYAVEYGFNTQRDFSVCEIFFSFMLYFAMHKKKTNNKK